MNRKLGKVSVKYFLNKKVKPIYKNKKVDTPCYPVCYYVVAKGLTITRSSLIARFANGVSEKDFDKYMREETLFKKEKRLIEQITVKYLQDEADDKIIDFSHCKWYGKSKVDAMNNINAYLDFYLTPISSLLGDLFCCMITQRIRDQLKPFSSDFTYILDGVRKAKIAAVPRSLATETYNKFIKNKVKDNNENMSVNEITDKMLRFYKIMYDEGKKNKSKVIIQEFDIDEYSNSNIFDIFDKTKDEDISIYNVALDIYPKYPIFELDKHKNFPGVEIMKEFFSDQSNFELMEPYSTPYL